MISVEEAITRILAVVRPLPCIHVPLTGGVHRFAAEDVTSAVDLPLFDNSAMDGYAVRADDLRLISSSDKLSLTMRARITAGETPEVELRSGECMRIFTGSKMPPGADAVVMQEDVEVAGDRVSFSEPVKPLENVRLRGEDVRRGTVLLRSGQRISAAHAALLAATGSKDVAVHQAPSVALLATGNEIREPGEPVGPGEIYESNRTMLASLVNDLHCVIHPRPIVRDSLQTTVEALQNAFAQADLVVSTGGVSVGEFDFVKEALHRLDGRIDLWRIAMRPGKPFVFGRLGEKLFFGLPGNPVSAFVTFLLFVRPALLKMHGASNLSLPQVPGELRESINNRGDRRHFARVHWAAGEITLSGPQKSHMVGALAQANALLDLPPGIEYPRGTRVNVLLFDYL